MVAINKNTELTQNFKNNFNFEGKNSGLDDLFAELFSLVNMESSENNIKTTPELNLTPEEKIPSDDNSIELAKSLIEVFYKEMGISQSNETKLEKDFDSEVKIKSELEPIIEFSDKPLQKKDKSSLNNQIREFKSLTNNNEKKPGTEQIKNPTNQVKSNNQNLLTQENTPLESKKKPNQDHTLKLVVKKISSEQFDQKVNKENLEPTQNIKKNKIVTENFNNNDPKKNIVANSKNQISEKKLLKKSKQGSENKNLLDHDTIPKKNFAANPKPLNIQKINTKNDSKPESPSSTIKNAISEKIEQTLIKRNSLPGANFNNQQVLDLMESSWGEKFTKVLKNAVSNGLNKVDLNLNPKHLGKIVLEISVKDNSTQVQINAESQDAANILNENISKLTEMIDEKNSKFLNFANNGEGKYSQQQKKDRTENLAKNITKKKEVISVQSNNKNIHNIDVQA